MRFALLLLLVLIGAAELLAAPASDLATKRLRVAELITELGSPEYVTRQTAARELESIGLVGFDQVLAATEHADPEIAAASRYLLGKFEVQWTQRDDSPIIKSRLKGYSQLSDSNRITKAASLSLLPRRQGIAALCRIARFDVSEEVSQRAAAYAMAHPELLIPIETLVVLKRSTTLENPGVAIPLEQITALELAQQSLEADFGSSERLACRWLRRLVELQRQAAEGDLDADAVRDWQTLVAQQQKVRETRSGEEGANELSALLWTQLRLQLRLAGGKTQVGDPIEDPILNAEAIAATVSELVQLSQPRPHQTLGTCLNWLLEAKVADEVIDQVIAAEQPALATKWGGYLTALVRDRQGRPEEANQLAEQAFAIPAQQSDVLMNFARRNPTDPRLEVGQQLIDRGQADWAWREFRDLIGQGEPLAFDTASAQWRLASSLQDRTYYAEAGEVLKQLVDAANESSRTKTKFGQMQRERSGLPSLTEIHARQLYYEALGQRAAGDEERARSTLVLALSKEETDADILIAMYRSPDADDDYRKMVRDRIRQLAGEFQELIDQDPNEEQYYNQWAWLVSNTEGDFQKAIRYSQRSLELEPDYPGFLDTLGRCYFAAGEIESAIETQRQAVALEPHTMVMQRQLAEFEAALARTSSQD